MEPCEACSSSGASRRGLQWTAAAAAAATAQPRQLQGQTRCQRPQNLLPQLSLVHKTSGSMTTWILPASMGLLCWTQGLSPCGTFGRFGCAPASDSVHRACCNFPQRGPPAHVLHCQRCLHCTERRTHGSAGNAVATWGCVRWPLVPTPRNAGAHVSPLDNCICTEPSFQFPVSVLLRGGK